MTIKVIITVNRSEVEEFKKGYAEFNYIVPDDEFCLDIFEEQVYNDRSEYICDADFERYIKEDE